jgi:hypothetical protein
MNKQITEDYVSFEIAKLLKEKGFRGKVHRWYTQYEEVAECTNIPHDYFDCPTFQMALKWLREVHNIVIEISMEDYVTSKNGELQVWYSYTIWTFIRHLGETGLTDARYDDRAFWQENVKVGQSFEEACEAALLYVLKNLI